MVARKFYANFVFRAPRHEEWYGNTMAMLEIRLLGALSVAAENGSEFPLQRKHKAFLAAIALAGPAGLTREKLADLFWGDRSERHAHANLRQALAATRRGLGAYSNCIKTEAERIAFDQATTTVDARMFEALTSSDSEEDRVQALGLYQGDLLDGVGLKEEGFEAWLRPLRERLRAKAIALWSDRLETADDAAACIDAALRLLALDATNEAGHRALMQSYVEQGQDNAALKQFAACREALDRELGIAPSRETLDLYRQIADERRPSGAVDKTWSDKGAMDLSKVAAVVPPSPSAKPTLTVMPFKSLSDEHSQDHFAAGITNDIISALLRHRWFSVISPTSMVRAESYAMIVDGQVVEANVDYVITGSVRKAGDRVRIAVQMVETQSGEHVWSDSYDRKLDDIFLLQDEITGTIAGHIDGEISASERRRVAHRPTRNMDAWDCYQLGMARFFKFTNDDLLEARQLFARSVELDPEFGEGHASWSYTVVFSTVYFDTEPDSTLLDLALQAAMRAVEIDDQNAIFHMRLARVYLALREYAKGLREMKTAVELNPNVASVYCAMGDALAYEGRYDESIAQFKKALRLGPRDPIRWAYLAYGALAHLFAGDFETTVDWSEKAMCYPHCQFWAFAHRVAALGHLGRQRDMREAVAELRLKEPRFSRSLAEQKLYFVKRSEQLQLYFDGLWKAGIRD